MLLSLLISTASANEATLPPPDPSVWNAPPQLSAVQSNYLRETRALSAAGGGLAVGAAALSTWVFLGSGDRPMNRGIAGANVAIFALPGTVLSAMALAPAWHLASAGVRWSPTFAVAGLAAGLGSVFVAAYTLRGTIPDESVFLAAGLAWAAPVLALSELLLASRAGWRTQDPGMKLALLPTGHGGHATMTWSF